MKKKIYIKLFNNYIKTEFTAKNSYDFEFKLINLYFFVLNFYL